MTIAPVKVSSNLNEFTPPNLGPGWTNLPGAINLFFIHQDFIASCKDIITSKRLRDSEGLLDNGLRLVEAPLNLTSACFAAIGIATQFFSFLKKLKNYTTSPFANIVNRFFPIIEIPMCTIEGVIEGININRSRRMINRLGLEEIDRLRQLKGEGEYLKNHLIAQLKTPALYQSVLTSDEYKELCREVHVFMDPTNPYKLVHAEEKTRFNTWRQRIEDRLVVQRLETLSKKYCQLEPKQVEVIDGYVRTQLASFSPEEQSICKTRLMQNALDVQNRELIRRVYPTTAKEIREILPRLVQEAPHSQEMMNKGHELLQSIKTQSQKSYLIHTIGIIAVIITLIAISLPLGGIPFLLPLVLFGIAGVFSMLRYTLHKGLMHTKGWHFDIEACTPKPILRFYRYVL